MDNAALATVPQLHATQQRVQHAFPVWAAKAQSPIPVFTRCFHLSGSSLLSNCPQILLIDDGTVKYEPSLPKLTEITEHGEKGSVGATITVIYTQPN